MDGGISLVAPFAVEADLIGPVCQGSLLHAGRHDDRELVLYSGPADPAGRRRLVLRVSDDGCRSWRNGAVVYEGAAAYSDLVVLEGGRIGCLFEADDYARITFRALTVAEASGAGG